MLCYNIDPIPIMTIDFINYIYIKWKSCGSIINLSPLNSFGYWTLNKYYYYYYYYKLIAEKCELFPSNKNFAALSDTLSCLVKCY